MFEYLKGTVVDIVADKIVMEVSGIGYRINSTANSISGITKGEYATIYTDLVVRENELNLYGFASMEELSMFQLLLSVTKIGPKVASAILSTHTPDKLGVYILNKDVRLISKAPGVGKKTAERIILELKDKVDKFSTGYGHKLYDDEDMGNDENEIVEALMALGYNKIEADKAVKTVKHKDSVTEDILKNALRFLAK
ncbi:MAG TPA: Holliday junction branch migration protein RuvA [Oscillospiraceae bacterium]|nr:Holliday junction branch migration protein RuvA [Oscillospiraceae bacterium]